MSMVKSHMFYYCFLTYSSIFVNISISLLTFAMCSVSLPRFVKHLQEKEGENMIFHILSASFMYVTKFM